MLWPRKILIQNRLTFAQKSICVSPRILLFPQQTHKIKILQKIRNYVILKEYITFFRCLLLFSVCRHWQSLSKMSWNHLKSLNEDPKTWGIGKNNAGDFESVLKRCGRFLTHLVLDNYYINDDDVDLIRRECPNLKYIDISEQQNFANKRDIANIKPIFDKVRRISCIIEKGVTDGNLSNLFSTNDKLEYLEISIWKKFRSFTFLDALSHETIRELKIESENVSFDRICQVSLAFQFSTFLVDRYLSNLQTYLYLMNIGSFTT